MQLVSVLISLVPFIVGSVAMPTWILLVVVLLTQARRRVEAMAFVAGVTLVRLAQGLVFGLILSTYDVPVIGGNHKVELAVSALLTGVGILLIAAGVQQLLSARSSLAAATPSSSEQLAPLEGAGSVSGSSEPRWLSVVRRITPVRSLLLGVVLVISSPRAWLFTIGAMGVIAQAYLRPSLSLAAYLFYVVGANVLIVAPILVSSSTWFDAAARWLEVHNQTLVIAVSLVIGCIFLWLGGTGLVAQLAELGWR